MNTRKTCFLQITGSTCRKVSLHTLLVLTLLLSPMIVHAATVTLAWDANTESDLKGYIIHYGTTSGVYSEIVDVANNSSGWSLSLIHI